MPETNRTITPASITPIVYLSEHVLATKTSLQFIPGVTYAEWSDVGFRLRDIEKSIHWWIGDWLRYGEDVWGEDIYSIIMAETGFTLKTLQNDKWVAGRFDISSRDEALSFSHHRMVADIENTELRSELLAQAKQNQWTVADLLEAKENTIPVANPRHVRIHAVVTAVETIPDDGRVDIVLRVPKGFDTIVRWFIDRLGLDIDAVVSQGER